ncbi:NUDIX hydrolase [Sporosarcina sp. Marseille-Q4063]|uniref:NUDIX hydrolase n=1 Tax=Sporosarcina sp. Marseille-Q4063 TaxID=2810514 RepID=UPI001BAEF4B7|nr:NUDIX domain-containing protein [Sporosarcina sp. Marseille-Q4063]QUW23628.1 NUDIX hydrolase [Sporosarcina sp. Marseille-Q4063]
MKTRRKVLAYITRGEEPDWEILVFQQKDNPEAGIQVPGGTIESDELIIDALYREIEEETGITRENLELKGKVIKNKYFPEHKNKIYERTIFHLSYIGDNDEKWEYIVKGDGKDEGMTFCHRFVPVDQIPELAGNQDEAINFLT